MEELIKSYAKYAEDNGFHLNPDTATVERVVRGLLANEEKNGEKYCPCRRLTGNKEEDARNICPCIYHKDEIAHDGRCYCGLYTK